MYSQSSYWEWNNYGCGGEDETACDVKVGKDEDGHGTIRNDGVINGTSELLV